jgi:hypothetical protein
MYICLCITCLFFCLVLTEIEFVTQILLKLADIKFHKNLSSGSRVVPCGQTDRRDRANIRFLQLGERT